MNFTRVAGGICLLAICVAGLVVAQAQSVAPPKAETAAGRTIVLMRTSMGDVTIELDAIKAPQTVDNFLQYADAGFYTNTLFHRVIEGFMIQGGGFSVDYKRKTTRAPVSNEAYNGLRNQQYTIAMARTTAPHSATSQFFINTADNRNLDHTDTTQRGWGYTVFGRVIYGQSVVDKISHSKTSAGGPFTRDAPIEPVVILSVERLGAEPATEKVTGSLKENAVDAEPALKQALIDPIKAKLGDSNAEDAEDLTKQN